MNALGSGSGKALTLHEALFTQPIVGVQHIEATTKLGYSNANRLASQLADLRLLREVTGKRRNRRFAYQPYLDQFADEELGPPGVG